MSNTNNGGPAFARPASDAYSHGMHKPQEGITLRDWFAGKAMQGLTQNIDWNIQTTDGIARTSYAIADAMLRARDGGAA